jgi:uncharacterized protein (TIGR02246 family)
VAGDEDAVRKAVNGFAEAWNRHDMGALASLFTIDADFVNVAGRRWKGRQAIRANHEFTHATIRQDRVGVDNPAHVYGVFRTSSFRYNEIEMRFIRPDVAVIHAVWTILGDTRTSEPRHGIMTIVAIRDHDAWLFSAVQNTEIDRTVR